MDTMEVVLIFKEEKEWNRKREERIARFLNGVESPYSYTYCDFLKSYSEYQITLKLSFPRFYYGNNAFLISSSDECKKVQKHFIKSLENSDMQEDIKGIKITRVDIPFTFHMAEDEEFDDYGNIFRILGRALIKSYPKANPKCISDLITEKKETITYADSKTISAYNSKLMIYDQYVNLRSKLDSNYFKKAKIDFRDLEKRIRMEVSKRVDRKEITLKKFAKDDHFKRYVKLSKEFLLDKIFCEELIDEVYEELIEELIPKLKKARDKSSFSYDKFILHEYKNIYDAQILKKAIKKVIEKKKTVENAITTVNSSLKEFEEENGLIFIRTRKKIDEMIHCIKIHFKGRPKFDYPF